MTHPYTVMINGEAMKSLIMNGFIDGNKYLYQAINNDDIDLCRWLLEAGFNSNHEYDGGNILHIAAHCNNIELMQLLLRYNKDINKKNQYGNTPLHITKNIDIIKLLLDHGADPTICNQDGHNPRELIIDYRNSIPCRYEYTDRLQEMADYLKNYVILPIKEPEL
jgi:ankyrin repeat protein